ncbi:uncharacterized protein LOC131944219 [Physella acuta]|uniref:uncharacterized protein LOC131944219 n=1 Tax=Physella acuta TaxID=109671 RepID=UPI0027DD9D88|nr:uncharacterized protein LOC131944219 [Physella acuta]
MNFCNHFNFNQNSLDILHHIDTPKNGVTSASFSLSSDLKPPSVNMVGCDVQALRSAQSAVVAQNLLVTFLVITMFVVTKSYYNHVRRQMARCTVFVIGAGPTGLTSALIASQSPHVTQVIVYEEMTKSQLIEKAHQVEFNRRSRDFLSCLGVDFDALEGCLENNIFHTRVGVFLEHLMNMLSWRVVPVTLRIGVKFSREKVSEIENYPGRKVVIASDGSSGQSARLLGLSDEFLHSSCHAFGAVASMDRTDLSSVPLAERRVHGLVFDLSAYGIELGDMDVNTGFTLKMFGSTRHRYMSLALPRSESTLVRHMRLMLDRSMMRNIFVKCFNACKWQSEAELTEAWALRHLKFSPRLFDIKLFQRLETVAYFQDTDMFVLVEGEAARCCNFHTGLDVNMAISGLSTLHTTLELAVCALTDMDIMSTMMTKSKHSESIAKQFLRTGLKQDVFTHFYC